MTNHKFDYISNEVQHKDEVFEPPRSLLAESHVSSIGKYYESYTESLNNPDSFWKNVAKELYFEKDSDRGLEYNLDHRKGKVFVKFMDGARSNISYNCLERNVKKGLGSKIAFIWEGNAPGDHTEITYQELLNRVISFSAALRSKGVRKGSTVAIYLPMVIELPIAMLACARIGAVHTVVFAGFSSESLAIRIAHTKAKVLVTADGCFRGNKLIQLKKLVDEAVRICENKGHTMETVIVLEHLKRVTIPARAEKVSESSSQKIDIFWDDAIEKANTLESPVEWSEAEDPLFILYTSGSTGTPKGILHTTIGYMVYTYFTTKIAFDAQKKDIYWSTADCGWITGHSYVTYGPLLNGMTVVIHEGIPTYPDAGRMWEIVEKHQVTKLYTAPTAVRTLMAFSDSLVQKHDRSSLKIIGTVGEPINPSAWKWLHHVVGESRCAIVDTYWQTETGGVIIAPMPGAVATKPGAATLPFFGIKPVLVKQNEIEGPGEGHLCISQAWPGMMRTIYGDYDRFVKTYFSTYPGYYFTGDGARCDHDSYYWITGRVDDLMNVSGHLLSTAEIESALVSHPDVVEAAVVAAPHDIKGQIPYAFVSLVKGKFLTDKIKEELKLDVREKIGALAIPDVIQDAPVLPKTRSGKITRRILRKIAEGDRDANLGDTTTLIDQSVIEQLWVHRSAVKSG